MARFADRVRIGAWTGVTGQPIRRGQHRHRRQSDLGPAMAYLGAARLRGARTSTLPLRLATSTAPTSTQRCATSIPTTHAVHRRLEDVHHDRDAHQRPISARAWLVERSATTPRWPNHFVAVSHERREVAAFGIDTANMFGFWDWVGGRYSVDSAIGLSLMIAIGPDAFREFLAGFHADRRALPHDAARARTLPVLLGLLGHLVRATSSAPRAKAVLPYAQELAAFPAYLQQLDMESQRQVGHLDGTPVDDDDRPDRVGRAGHERPARLLPTAPPGHPAGPGRLHRLRARRTTRVREHHDLLMANLFAQAEALAFGKTPRRSRPRASRRTGAAPVFPGNRPTHDDPGRRG